MPGRRALDVLNLIALCLVMLAALPAVAQETPEIDSPIVDLAGRVPDATESMLDRRLRSHYTQTGVQMAVLVVDSTDGEPIEDYSLRVANAWSGGRAGEDRGVLLTLAIQDRRSRLEVGYGLEAALPDAASAHILRSMRGELRSNRYGDAVELGVDKVVDLTDHLEPGRAVSAAPGLFWLDTELGFTVTFLVGLFLAGLPVLLRRNGVRWLQEKRGAAVIFAISLVAALGVGLLAMEASPFGFALAVLWGSALAWTFASDEKTLWIATLLYAGFLIAALAIPNYSPIGGPGFLSFIVAIFLQGMWWALGVVAMIGITAPGTTGSSTYSSGGYSGGGYSGSSGGYSGGGGSFGGGGASGGW